MIRKFGGIFPSSETEIPKMTSTEITNQTRGKPPPNFHRKINLKSKGIPTGHRLYLEKKKTPAIKLKLTTVLSKIFKLLFALIKSHCKFKWSPAPPVGASFGFF